MFGLNGRESATATGRRSPRRRRRPARCLRGDRTRTPAPTPAASSPEPPKTAWAAGSSTVARSGRARRSNPRSACLLEPTPAGRVQRSQLFLVDLDPEHCDIADPQGRLQRRRLLRSRLRRPPCGGVRWSASAPRSPFSTASPRTNFVATCRVSVKALRRATHYANEREVDAKSVRTAVSHPSPRPTWSSTRR